MESQKYHMPDGPDMDPTILKNAQIICLYFSASWCPPCREFTSKLAEFYSQVNEIEKKVEIIFCSCDKNKELFQKYFKTMPWIAHPFNEKQLKVIGDQYEVSRLPTLLVMNSDKTVCIKNGMEDVKSKGPACVDEWIPKVK